MKQLVWIRVRQASSDTRYLSVCPREGRLRCRRLPWNPAQLALISQISSGCCKFENPPSQTGGFSTYPSMDGHHGNNNGPVGSQRQKPVPKAVVVGRGVCDMNVRWSHGGFHKSGHVAAVKEFYHRTGTFQERRTMRERSGCVHQRHACTARILFK